MRRGRALRPHPGLIDSEIDEWYWADLEETVSQIDRVLANPKFADWWFYYRSSW